MHFANPLPNVRTMQFQAANQHDLTLLELAFIKMENIFQAGLKEAISLLPEHTQEDARRILAKRILAGGELVTEPNRNARIDFCKTRLAGNPCEYFGPVFPGGLEFKEGCQACNCPMITKAAMKTITNPVMAQLFQGGQPEITCKHPSGNLWENVDEQFKEK